MPASSSLRRLIPLLLLPIFLCPAALAGAQEPDFNTETGGRRPSPD